MARSTFFSRLALALLALCGFVAPLAPARDVIVQHAGAAPRPVDQAVLARVPKLKAQPRAPKVVDAAPSFIAPVGARRYLLHRAWLI